MMQVVLQGSNKLVGDINKYQIARRQAVAGALNKGILRIRNDLVMSMKKTPRQSVFGAMQPPTMGLEGGAQFGKMKHRSGDSKLMKRGGSKPHSNRRGGKRHEPSQAGFPPAIDTGRLVNSLRLDYANVRTPPVVLVAELSTSVFYAPRLEYGGKKGKRRLAARPAWRPAFNRQLPQIRTDVKAAFASKGVY